MSSPNQPQSTPSDRPSGDPAKHLLWVRIIVVLLVLRFVVPPLADGACCYFAAKKVDVLQPAQKAFITWNPKTKIETFTVQPKFEGNALDFGMVIPTPTQPKLHEMPRDFFKHLAVYSILGAREQPYSSLLFRGQFGGLGGLAGFGGLAGIGGGLGGAGGVGGMPPGPPPRRPQIKILDTGLVGSLDYKVIKAERADDLYRWLKKNNYTYQGDEATLNHYIKKKWVFTVMKIDTMQMKKRSDGTYIGAVTPTRFRFRSEKLVYPLKITQISIKKKTEALFYIQAPYKMDMKGDFSYQHTWVPMLRSAQACSGNGLPGKGDDYLAKIKNHIPAILQTNQKLGFRFVAGQRPQPNAKGRTPTTMEWARKLTPNDIGIVTGQAPYSETVPNVDRGFIPMDMINPMRAAAVRQVIQTRLAICNKVRPRGFFIREAPKEEIRGLRNLAGHLQEGAFITKMRKVFTKAEMNEDLEFVQAKIGKTEDVSEYTEILPVSPP
ncbi:MAG: DUF2330 domain-containing protein [Gemmataceae bacterium]